MNRCLSSLPTWLYWYPLRFLTRVLPRQTVVVLGFVTGFFSFWLRPGKRRIVQREIRNSDTNALSPAALKKLTRNSFQQSCAVMMETFCFPRICAGNIDRWMRAYGIDNLNHALARGKGVVIVLAHYGANQMVMAALGYRGYTINQIGSRPDDWHRLSGRKPTRFETRIFDLRMALERSLPATFIYIDKSMRPVYTALRNNQIMILAADGRAGTRFFTVPSGRRHINVSAGPFRIAASTGAALIPAFPVRDSDGIHDLYIESPIQPENTDSMDSWAENAARLYAGRLNEWIQLKPDHYAMLMAEAFVRSDRDPVPLFEDYRHAAETGS